MSPKNAGEGEGDAEDDDRAWRHDAVTKAAMTGRSRGASGHVST